MRKAAAAFGAAPATGDEDDEDEDDEDDEAEEEDEEDKEDKDDSEEEPMEIVPAKGKKAPVKAVPVKANSLLVMKRMMMRRRRTTKMTLKKNLWRLYQPKERKLQ